MVQWDKEPAEISQQTFKLMELGHEIEFKYLDKMNSYSSKKVPLLLFEFSKCFSDEMS
jgi:hypothetical protein